MRIMKHLAGTAAVVARAAGIITLLALPGMAWAAPPQLPEPETLALVGIGAVALAIARWRNKK